MPDPRSTELASLTEEGRKLLAAMLGTHGHAALRDGSRVTSDGLVMELAVDDFKQQGDTWLLQISVTATAAAWGDRAARDTLAGMGPSPEQALTEGVRSWFHGVLPVLKASLGLSGAEEELTRTELAPEPPGHPDRRWRIIGGPIQARGATEDGEVLGHALTRTPPLDVLRAALREELPKRPGPVVFLKLFLQRQVNGPLAGECRLDGETWEQGYRELLTYPWPEVGSWQAFKQYLVIQPITAGGAGPGRPRGGCLGVLAGTAVLLWFLAVDLLRASMLWK